MTTTDNLNNQRKYAWAQYYQLLNRTHSDTYSAYQTNTRLLETATETLPLFLLKEIRELHKKQRSQLECPVCMEIIELDGLKITSCGHKYCEKCYMDPRLEKCAICRKKIYRKQINYFFRFRANQWHLLPDLNLFKPLLSL